MVSDHQKHLAEEAQKSKLWANKLLRWFLLHPGLDLLVAVWSDEYEPQAIHCYCNLQEGNDDQDSTCCCGKRPSPQELCKDTWSDWNSLSNSHKVQYTKTSNTTSSLSLFQKWLWATDWTKSLHSAVNDILTVRERNFLIKQRCYPPARWRCANL